MTGEVLVRRNGQAGVLSLNRPRALHALNQPMVEIMTEALLAWRDDPSITAVIIDHAVAPDGEPRLSRGFCAGGDIAMMRQSALEDGGAAGRAFFLAEYRLNHLMFTYVKPIITFMDGITMGGGVGLSLPARWRVATARTRLAMPETGIGLFPDVGGGWFLSRLKGRLGHFMALTGARLDGAECCWAGLATHFLPDEALALAKERIAGGETVATVLDDLATHPGAAPLAAYAPDIARHFVHDTLAAIWRSLGRDPSPWATQTLATLKTRAPLSSTVSLRQLQESLALPDFAANMAMEYRIAARVMLTPDFAEGVRAVIIDKDNAPRWNPARPEDVEDSMVEAIFAPLPHEEEWTPL
ncbi:MAG TPA: enoyl-CoA hydratase/isomerase family protein [Novosphingobium capsulatum]|jgi:enoyl-CoA hydratase|nr:enoyl-CoA hydratase/isomerase family protein [Novosphingobium capsulatum]